MVVVLTVFDVVVVNPLSSNNVRSLISHSSIKGVSIREIMRIENMITQVQFS